MKRIDVFLLQHEGLKKTYMICAERHFTYCETNRIIRSASSFLRRLHIERENVGVFACNSPEYIFAYFANICSGSTNIPVNVKLTDPEIVSELKYCDCNWILVQTQYVDRLLKIANTFEIGVIEVDKYGCMKLIKEKELHASRENDIEIAVMLHTSGTTGNPKKVMLSHRNIDANTWSNIESLKLDDDDVVLVALPLFFGYCHTAQFLTHTRLGGTIVIYDEPVFSAKHFCDLVDRYSVTCFTGVPTMLTMIDDYRYIDKYNLSSLRYICFGGGSVSLEMLRRLMKKIPNAGIVQTYGQTECSPRVTALLPEDSLNKIGSVGKAIPGVAVEIVNESNNIIGSGEIGEIRVKGGNTTPGYYKNQEESRKILRNSWLYTGDFAKYDDDGYIYLVGRKKNMIISGGINVYPEDIENVIKCYPPVEDVVVKGEKDELMGEIPVAYIVLKSDIYITIDNLYRFLDEKLARYKWPKKIVIVDSFEKTATGKTKRRSIDALIPNTHKYSSPDKFSNAKSIIQDMCDKKYDLVVSLGTTCQVAHQLRRLGLRRCAGPFDWFITPFESMLKLLKSRFGHFMLMKNLKIVGDYQNSNSIVEDVVYKVKSYHDFPMAGLSGDVWDSYLLFKNKINRRVKRFLGHLETLDEILFVINAGNVSIEDYLSLVNIIGSLRGGKGFHVFANGYSVPQQADGCIKNISFVRFDKFRMPRQSLTWRRGCDEEWDNCTRDIRLKKKSEIGY